MGTRVFLGGLPQGIRERDVEKFFKGYGRLRSINLKMGYGFVEFEDDRDADDAVDDLNGKELLGERINVERARGIERRGGGLYGSRRGPPPRRGGSSYSNRPPTLRTEWRLVVENLSTRISWQDLKDIMRDAGCEVTYANAHNRLSNEGVVEFATLDDMNRALDKLEGKEYEGRRIHLYEAANRRRLSSRNSRSRSRSRRRSQSRSKSRSRSRSRSRSADRKADRSKDNGDKRSRSRSRSRSGDRSVSRSPSRSPGGGENGDGGDSGRE